MVAVSEISWEEVASPDFGNPARAAFRQAVAEVADKAKLTLPQCNGRVESAIALVLAGDVELLDDGKARVASGSSAKTTYLVEDGTCPCKDFEQAPSHWCKHRIAAGLMKRAVGRADALLDAQAAAPEPEPTPPVDTPRPPHEILKHHLVTIQGRVFVKYSGLLELAQERGLVKLEARFISVTAELALADATATFADGRVFTEAGDASPANVGKQVAAHYPRMALTRAKARCLRDALSIGMCSLEELGD
jgi:hypothetical protein